MKTFQIARTIFMRSSREQFTSRCRSFSKKPTEYTKRARYNPFTYSLDRPANMRWFRSIPYRMTGTLLCGLRRQEGIFRCSASDSVVFSHCSTTLGVIIDVSPSNFLPSLTSTCVMTRCEPISCPDSSFKKSFPGRGDPSVESCSVGPTNPYV